MSLPAEKDILRKDCQEYKIDICGPSEYISDKTESQKFSK